MRLRLRTAVKPGDAKGGLLERCAVPCGVPGTSSMSLRLALTSDQTDADFFDAALGFRQRWRRPPGLLRELVLLTRLELPCAPMIWSPI